jgi:RecJ-like exonuclease
MKEKTLLKVALTCSLVGIVVILFISESMEVKKVKIGKINEEMVGEDVRIVGKVVKVLGSSSSKKIDVEDSSGKIRVTVFDEFEIERGKVVEVEGEVSEYKGELGLNGKKIKEKK